MKGGDPVTQNEAINNVLSLARAELGYHEKASNSQLDSKTANSGGGNWTKFAGFLDSIVGFYNGPKNGYAWCDVFVDYLFVKIFGLDAGREMLCQPMNSAGAGCLYSSQYYKNAGRWFGSPQPGDQIFFTYAAGEVSHTGIVEEVKDNTVTTIEGNSSDQVARRAYTLSNPSIYGYGRPRWEYASSIEGCASTGSSSAEKEAHAKSGESHSSSQAKSYGMLIRGSEGEAVKDLQQKLIDLGYDIGRYGADGEFGSETLRAVKQFQKDHGLDVDGVVGEMTMEAINTGIEKIRPKAPVSVVVPDSGSTSTASRNTTTEPNRKPAQPAPINTKAGTNKKASLSKGDIVEFTGSRHYWSSNAKIGTACKPGRAKITAISSSENVRHPYHLVRVRGGGSTVYGWVGKGDIKAV